jgi:holo-[acyl-carrier protein] synthase
MVEVRRIREILEREGSRFETRIFSADEIAYCRSLKDPFPSFAARFAAKEAYSKALGIGILTSGPPHQIEVIRDDRGAPHLRLSGVPLEHLQKLGAQKTLISLAHEGEYAIASVILI